MSERDVGLFSLVQQVIGNVPWALAEGRVPIVDFGSRTCYWTPRGLGGRDNVWEYYFEPLHPDRPAASIPSRVRAATAAEPPAADEVGYGVGAETFVTAHFGDHPYLDGSLDGSHQRWLELLNRPNDFLIHSNDLHEIRATDRAIRLANGELVCLVQDDDQIPTEDGWLDEILAEFSADPALAIVGGFMGFDSFHPDPARARPVWGSGDFRFVHHVNIGPYFLRRRAYEKLGGWDHSFSAPGEPGICFDSELCLRAWLEGFRVGYRFVPFKGPAGHYAMDGGTVLFSAAERERNRLSNAARIYRRYAPHEAHIDEMVSHANSSMAERVSLPD